MAGTRCDCCNRERPTQVAASPLGPVSSAYCQECAEAGAEPEWTVRYLWEDIAQRDWERISPDVVVYTTVYKNGEYINLRKWSELYGTPSETSRE